MSACDEADRALRIVEKYGLKDLDTSTIETMPIQSRVVSNPSLPSDRQVSGLNCIEEAWN